MTKAESRKETRKGATTAPQASSSPMDFIRSKRGEGPSRKRVPIAPSNASQELLTNQQRTMVTGTPLCSSAARCAGRAQANRNHHDRTGLSNNTAIRIEFGGHMTETGCG